MGFAYQCLGLKRNNVPRAFFDLDDPTCSLGQEREKEPAFSILLSPRTQNFPKFRLCCSSHLSEKGWSSFLFDSLPASYSSCDIRRTIFWSFGCDSAQLLNLYSSLFSESSANSMLLLRPFLSLSTFALPRKKVRQAYIQPTMDPSRREVPAGWSMWKCSRPDEHRFR